MRVVVVTAPEPVVTWEQVDAHLELGGDDDRKTQVMEMAAEATAALDGPDGELGRALGVQTLQATFDAFPCDGGFELPCRPIRTITGIAYVDQDGNAQTLDATAYRLSGNIVDTVFGMTWPATRGQSGAVQVTYTAGYETIPLALRRAILLMVGDMFRYRETASADGAQPNKLPVSFTVDRLIQPFRVYR